MSRILKTIEMDLSAESIGKAVNELEKFREQLQKAMQDLCERLMEEGVSMAKLEIKALDAVDTGALMASIGHGIFNTETRTGIVYAGGYYAFYVEYGTGIVGTRNPHPGLSGGEMRNPVVLGGNLNMYTGYDSQEHGGNGWWYMEGGQFHWTKGMPSRPFMYNTFRYLENLAERIGAETVANRIT